VANFPTEVFVEDLHKIKFVPKPENNRVFWIIQVPLAFVLALVVSILTQVNVLLPAWGVFTILLWGAGVGKEKEKDGAHIGQGFDLRRGVVFNCHVFYKHV